MSVTHYYLAEKGTKAAETLDAAFTREAAAAKQIAALRKELGASKTYSSMGFGSVRLSGFAFTADSDADPLRLRFDKRRGIWRPRANTKAGRELQTRMDSIELLSGNEVADVIGVKTMLGMRIVTPGCEPVACGYLLTVDAEAGKPKGGCRRISDLEAEAMRKRSKRRGGDA